MSVIGSLAPPLRRYNSTMVADTRAHQPRLLGLHHVTATADDAQADLDFCLDVLGLRLVKKTVNFDNHFVYHFYYGDAVGNPGTLWTTFPYKGHGVRIGVKGAGQVTVTAFSRACLIARRVAPAPAGARRPV